jgi:hypothetical protein
MKMNSFVRCLSKMSLFCFHFWKKYFPWYIILGFPPLQYFKGVFLLSSGSHFYEVTCHVYSGLPVYVGTLYLLIAGLPIFWIPALFSLLPAFCSSGDSSLNFLLCPQALDSLWSAVRKGPQFLGWVCFSSLALL